MLAWLRRRRVRVEAALSRRGLTHTFSLARRRLRLRLAAAIREYAGGDCLDCGSGRSPYRHLLRRQGSSVTSVDIEDRSGEVDLLADIQEMPQIGDGSFDTILCTQVLEHVPRPWRAMAELSRVLRPGGQLILSVPHLSAVHEPPHDFYRYTRFGLTALCTQSGLEVLRLEPTGGLVSFLAHGVSLGVMSTLAAVPGLMWPVWLFNYLFLVLLTEPLDHLLGLAAVYPCDYVLVARRIEAP
jgi:SAM-dependent methyltransferase